MRHAALLVVLVLAGCGATPGAPAAGVTGEPVVYERWTSCDDAIPDRPDGWGGGLDATAAPPLGEEFTPMAAVVCRQGPQERPGGAGTDLVAVESRADDIDALVAALRLPSQPRTDGACTMDLPSVDWFALLDDRGRWVRPGIPVDACAKPRIEVREAVQDLQLTVVRSRVIRELESSAAAMSGCGQSWADMVWVEASQGFAAPGRSTALPFGAAPAVRLCLFHVPDKEKGSGKPAGEFERGTAALPASRWREIAAAILAAPPARACATPAGRFALLRAADNTGGEIYVELDACQRILVVSHSGKPVLAQGGPALAALLRGD